MNLCYYRSEYSNPFLKGNINYNIACTFNWPFSCSNICICCKCYIQFNYNANIYILCDYVNQSHDSFFHALIECIYIFIINLFFIHIVCILFSIVIIFINFYLPSLTIYRAIGAFLLFSGGFNSLKFFDTFTTNILTRKFSKDMRTFLSDFFQKCHLILPFFLLFSLPMFI